MGYNKLIAEKRMNRARPGRHSLVWLIVPAMIALTIASCKPRGTSTLKETPTSGDIVIGADESFRLIVDAEVDTFTALYPYAQIRPIYKAENELVADFLNDSVRTIVSSWTPSDEQRELLLNVQTVVRTTVVAYDALALVLNRKNADSLLTYDNVRDIFNGKITDWNQINPKSRLGQIYIVFDNIHSGNIRYFRERFDLPAKLAPNFYAVKSNPEVIDYVASSPGALGIVSVNWISDTEDPGSMDLQSRIKVAAISQPYLDPNTFYMPVQGSIYDKTYPFVREVVMNTRESFSGLGSGFVSFVAGEKGQRIILKSGLVPATMPIRIIQVKNE